MSIEKLKRNTKVIFTKDSVTAVSTISDLFFVDNAWVEEHTFVGVARLKDRDTSDRVNAKNIALSKLERNFHNIIKNTYNEIIKDKEKELFILKEEVNKHVNASNSITRHIIDISNK